MRGFSTRNATVLRLEVRLQILRTGFGSSEERVGDRDLAGSSPRTPRIRQFDDVRRTADVTVVDLGAATDLHPAVARMRHEDDVTGVARCVERFSLAERLKELTEI